VMALGLITGLARAMRKKKSAAHLQIFSHPRRALATTIRARTANPLVSTLEKVRRPLSLRNRFLPLLEKGIKL
jgi:hypothetical protein